MKAVHKDQANNTNACTSTEYDDADVEYLYTASQQRLCKIVKPHKAGGAGISDQSDWEYTWYMYDAGGMVMAVYDQSFRPNDSDWTVNFDLEEHDVYGSGRLGIRHGDDAGKYHQDFSATITSGLFDAFSYSGSSSAYAKEHYSRTIGLKQYEVANHLGNVLVTVSDKRLVQDNYHYTLVGLGSDYSYNADLDAYYYTPGAGVYTQTSGADGVLDWYTPDVLSYSDYYAFGAPQTGRNGGDGYRYGFNGKESDDEVKGVKGSHQDYGMRMYDPRVGRFFSADPLMFAYPYYTPYQFAGNMPIACLDLDGCEPYPTIGYPSSYSNQSLSTYQTPNNGTVDVPDGGTAELNSEHQLVSYSWTEGDITYSLSWQSNNSGNDCGSMGGQYVYSSSPSDEILTTMYGTTDFHLPSDEEWDAFMKQNNLDPNDPFGAQAAYNEQQRQADAQAQYNQSLMQYYGNNYFFGSGVYYTQQCDQWCESEQAATYIGGPLKLIAFSAFPIGDGLGLLSEGVNITATEGTITVFRAVDATEAASISNTGRFMLQEGGTEVKYFAQSLEDANWYGQKLYPNGYTIVQGIVKPPLNAAEYWYPNIDIGAYAFPQEALFFIVPK